jgi:hypothetical protein|tara:strand:- start:201 stop:515 length:315 start_codon:yes stop_codon:yes gene_type:complete
MAEVLAWIAANPGTTAAIAGSAEAARKTSKSESMQRNFQEREARKAEKKQERELRAQAMIRQEEKKRQGMIQQTPVTKNPFASKRKDIRSQFTIGGGGDSGVNY